ncbi:heme biosynthesis protein HemY [Aliiroseovarius crassostreae]|uniref:heme biosynthesis protein HemY n=1 Tax=Aliiroseovarius crassostreae TaxID=154981 RepID=UPI0021FFA224|nr:heme biosynthesis HemY N-terminal domain-containing protein [Aliiroseovarius crassostreae]UWP89029.1 heme biosynthesis protein HemY [Aliiroseovarius crassostreae]UWQ01679.1 heme biosynthesis protein HemY [Aliiroseovarius crassostreae]
MLWSLFKIILFVVAIAGLTLGAGALLELDGGIQVAVAGVELNLGPLQAVILFGVLIVVVWLVIVLFGLLRAVLRFLNGDETAISRYFDRSREKKGYEALADGMMALASGESATAMAKANRAEKYLRRPELTNLLTAQAAEMAGDKRKATQVYKKLLTDERTKFVGVRGLMKQKLEEGDTATAMRLAEKALALKPRHVGTQDALLGMQAAEGDWSGARKTLTTKLKTGNLPRDVHKRRDAVLALSEAKDVLAEGKSVEAREAAIEANRLSPDLVPAAVMAARTYAEQGKPRYATRVLTKAWTAQPHPDIAAAFAEIEPDESPKARLNRFRALTKHREGDAETRMLVAELNLAAGDYVAARKALGNLSENDPTQRVLTLLAAIERGEGAEDKTVRALLARALTAPRGPQWVCDKCNHIHADWAPVCGNCGGFDTLSWSKAPETEGQMSGGADMMPLIVGEDAPVEVERVSEVASEPEETTPDLPLEGEVVATPSDHVSTEKSH